jgi:hypothetical protein
VSKCRRFLWLLWRVHCWHMEFETGAVFGECRKPRMATVETCCRCKATKTEPYGGW